ncbi:hypothetical protein E8E13_007641 [Curvularia kusanoi]|uniref:Uncharacterized protein n=1 Tax=Curvularia kusanoi TaxID=90978 RepID=A0A9P4TMH2_CURKU|nr:hypothetical protein E8E13_007641 [Curvularia kusanoi]
MATAIVSTQLPRWNYEKPTINTRTDRSGSDSSASSPNLCNDDHETLRLNTTATQPIKKGSIVLQERYMSSEEDLSPACEDSASESEYDYDDAVIEDLTAQCHSAKRMSVSRWNQGKSCDTAVKVSYAFVGRPKVVELNLGSPVLDRPMLTQRSASLANLPATALKDLQKADMMQRHSLNVVPVSKNIGSPLARPISPLAVIEPRRPSTSYSPSSKTSTLNLGDLTSTASSTETAPTSRSASPVIAAPIRPSSATPEASRPMTASSRRSSVYVPTGARPELQRIKTTQTHFRHSHQIAPPTPMSPATHAFLNTDPFAKAPASNTAIPANKPSTHKRLRSISMKLSLARIAITPSSKKNGNVPASPYTPLTPQTAPFEAPSGFSSPMPNKLRRASTILRPKSRGAEDSRGPSPDMLPPPIPVLNRSSTMGLPQRHSKMVARGANEREPTLILPPFLDMDANPVASVKSGKLRKRKSLMDLL